MTGGLVTLLTEEWRPLLKQIRYVRSMRVMADRTILRDRKVIPEERPALLHVTGVAGLHHTVLLHQLGARRAMRRMTIGTNHFAFFDRMAGRTVDHGPLFGMAVHAHFGHRRTRQSLVITGVQFVALGTCHVSTRVLAAQPQGQLVTLVAIDTRLIVLGDILSHIFAKGVIR